MQYLICRVREEERWQLSSVLGKVADPSFAVKSLEHCQLENCPACQSNGDRRIIESQGCKIASFLRPKGCRDFMNHRCVCVCSYLFKLTLADLRAPLWKDSSGSLCFLHLKRTSFGHRILNEAYFPNKAHLSK